jgi:hypothetical protein
MEAIELLKMFQGASIYGICACGINKAFRSLGKITQTPETESKVFVGIRTIRVNLNGRFQQGFRLLVATLRQKGVAEVISQKILCKF